MSKTKNEQGMKIASDKDLQALSPLQKNAPCI